MHSAKHIFILHYTSYWKLGESIHSEPLLKTIITWDLKSVI